MRRALGGLFAAVARARLAAYRHGIFRRHGLAGPVISVGNLSVGGSGKTPVVRFVAEMLRDAGRPVAILSRGYGGRFKGDVLVVSDGKDVLAGAAEAGDEPVMLARALPGVVVAVGPRRDVVGRAVEARFGQRVHVLDDGFQHLRLQRDLDLVCLDVEDLDDRPLPAGRLREGPAALERADLFLLTRLEAATEDELQALEARLGSQRTFRVSRRIVGWRHTDGADAPVPGQVFLFAGIARPERFETDAVASGATVLGRSFFPDHHRYHLAEVEAMVSRARASGAQALGTTAKDAVRLGSLASETSGLPLLVLHVDAVISDEDRFERQLFAAVESGVNRARRYALEAKLTVAVSAVVRRLPRRLVLALGRSLGRVWGALDKRHLRIAVDNLRHAFPEWDDARVLRTARGVYGHFGAILFDILWLERRSADEILALTDVEGLESTRAAVASGRGVVCPTGHFGNWEFQGVASALLVGPFSVVARPLDNPELDRKLVGLRTATGNRVIYKKRALSQILQTIREGGVVAIVVDQNVQAKDGIFVDFFGRRACTTTVAAAIALKTECMILPVHCPLGADGRYRMVYGPPVEWKGGRGPEDVAALTQQLTAIIEGWVREHPEQWLWLHRRWKTRPPEEAVEDPPPASSTTAPHPEKGGAS